MSHLLSGVTVPVITALRPDRRPDPESARPLLRALAAIGVKNLMFFGTNGEGALIDPHRAGDYLLELAPYWRELAGPDAVVFATASGAGTREALNRGRIFVEAAPDALVVAPPYYFVHTERELEAHYAALADLGLPIILYNAPRYTGNPITPALLARLASLPHVVGLKDSGGHDALLRAAVALRAEVPSFGVSQGDERGMTAALAQGADGVTPGLANLAPGECLALVDAVRRGDDEAAALAQDRLARLLAIHAMRGGVAAMKGALSLRGLSGRTVSPPLLAVDGEELHHIAQILRNWDGALIG